MPSITFRPEEGSCPPWKKIDDLVPNVVDEPTTNARRETFKRKQAKERRIIYDSVKVILMPVINPLKTAK